MSAAGWQRVLAGAFLALGVAAGFAWHAAVRADARAQLAEQGAAAARSSASRLQAALENRRHTLESQARVLAFQGTLRRGILTDAATMQDLVHNEDLQTLRDPAVLAVARVSDVPVPEVLLARGIDEGRVRAALAGPLQAATRADAGPSSVALALEGAAALVAAAPVSSYDGSAHGTLLVGSLLDEAALRALSAQVEAALVLRLGTREVAGSGEGSAGLSRALGASPAPAAIDAGRALALQPVDLAPDTVLWVGAPLEALSKALAASARSRAASGWVVSLVVAGALAAALWLRSRRRPPDAVAPSALDVWAGVAPAPVAPAPAADPMQFGRYRLVDRLGAGGMAEVWLALAMGAEGFRRPVVVKRVRRDMAENPEFIRPFIDEARLGARLLHPGIGAVLDFGQLGGEYYLVQEYVPGRDLGRLSQALARAGRRLDPGAALWVLAETLRALDHAHNLADTGGRPLGVVHRDVAPGNVLAGLRGEVKLIDFGIAKAAERVSTTENGTVKGNVRFMAPEQARGAPLDGRADLFSLGATLFHVLAGEALYAGTGAYDLLVAAARGPGEPERARVAALPEPLATILDGMLRSDPDERCPSARACLERVLPHVPADGAQRLGAVVQELFGEELREQEQRILAAAAHLPGAPGIPGTEEQTVRRPSPRLAG